MKPLISPLQLKQLFPLTAEQQSFIHSSRSSIQKILNNTDSSLLLIIGPCSIHDPQAAVDYALKIKAISSRFSSRFSIAMRTYFEKPRTSVGWKGMLYDPFLDGSHDIEAGLIQTRKLLLELIKIGVPTATEFLDPLTSHYYEDLICWGSIGARTSSSQTHRQLASGLSMPIGIKNGLEGDINTAVNGVLSVSQPHTYLGVNEQCSPSIIRTSGNNHAHLVLRGGELGPNYDSESIKSTLNCLGDLHLPRRLIVDCSHGNSRKLHENQKYVFNSVLTQFLEGNSDIRGLMLESNLFEGCQSLSSAPAQLEYGVSITDSCLSWRATEELIESAFNKMEECDRLEKNYSKKTGIGEELPVSALALA